MKEEIEKLITRYESELNHYNEALRDICANKHIAAENHNESNVEFFHNEEKALCEDSLKIRKFVYDLESLLNRIEG